MALMDIFKASPQPQPQQQAPNGQQAANGDGTQPTTGGEGISNQQAKTNKDGTMAGTNQTTDNPLDVYNKIWDNANKSSDVAPVFALDDKLLTDVSSKLNFTDGISPELMQKATSGDTAALLQVINAVGQQSYKAALAHSSKLTDTFIGKRSEYDLKNVGSQVKSEMTSAAISALPNASHPVVQRELKRVADAMRSSNPDATPQQIAEASQNYMRDLASALAGTPKTAKEQQDAEAVDWDAYLKQSMGLQ